MYDELFEAWLKEKESAEVQKIPEDFYAKLAKYVKKLKEERRMLDEKSVKAKLLRHEAKNAKFLVEELIKLRCEKILSQTKTGKPIPDDKLAIEEKHFQGKILSLTEFYHSLLKDILKGHSMDMREEKKPVRLVVRFLKDVPAIIGADMKVYGPFKREDVGVLPLENAKILLKQGLAAEIEMK
jgi:DNA replication factor GINS